MLQPRGERVPLSTALGIDFGTSTTLAALAQQGEVRVVEAQGGTVFTPSAVWYAPNGERHFGQDAIERRLVDPANTIVAAKRILGRPWHSREVLEYRNQYSPTLVRGSDDQPRFSTRAGELTPGQVTAAILRHVAAYPQLMGLNPHPVTITVPVAARADQRQATLQAAREAGLKDLDLVDEPSAAALAYQHLHGAAGILAIYDLGGGTFDLAIVRAEGSEVTVLASSGDTYLGGDDITFRLAHWAADSILQRHHWDVRSNPESFQALFVAAEAAKIALSAQTSTRIHLGDVDPNLDERYLQVEQSQLNELCHQLVRRTFVLCDQVLADAKLGVSDIHRVLMVGGGSHMSAVRRGVEHYFGRRPSMELDPTTAVVTGATVHAARRQG